MPRASLSSPPSDSAAPPPRFRSPFLTAVLLALLCFGVRIPLLNNALPLPPDGHEYLNVAWNLANGYGFRKTIKWSYYKPHPVVHSALGARPILYSLVLTPIVKVTPRAWLPLTLRAFSVLLCMGTVILGYLLWLRLYSPRIALAGGILLAVQPGFMDIGTLPLTEPLLLFLLAWIFYLASRARSWAAWGGIGVLIALAYLTRPNGIFLLPVFIGYLLLQARKPKDEEPGTEDGADATQVGMDGAVTVSHLEREGELKDDVREAVWPSSFTRSRAIGLIAALFIGFVVTGLPFWIANARVNGSAFASDLQLAYAVRSVRDATWEGFGRDYMRPLQFITTHTDVVMEEMYRQTWIMLPTFANSLPFLMAFTLFIRRKQLQGLPGAMFVFGVLNLLFYCLSWNVTGATRYLLPSTFCFIGPLLHTVFSLNLPPLRIRRGSVGPVVLLFALMFIWYQPWVNRLYKSRTLDRMAMERNPMYRVTARWLHNQHPPPDAVVASNNPWMVDYYTHLPAVVCPSFDSPARVAEFVKEYRVRYIIFFGEQHVGDRDERVRETTLPHRYHHLPPKVQIFEFPPKAWE